MATDLKGAAESAERGDFGAAWQAIDGALEENPNDVRALVLASYCCEKQGKLGLAYTIARRVIELKPNEPAGWTNLGRAADLLWRMEEADHAYRQALRYVDTPRAKALNLVNLSAVYLQIGQFEKARKYAEQALEIEPDNRKARHNLGLCQLAARQWADGWKNYHASVGSGQRIRWSYVDEPEWQGEPGRTVVIYGEQGIGDEICAASMYQDALRRAGRVIIDCDPRLADLFRRSFPGARVYGTRTQKDGLAWDEEDRKIDFSISSMQLGGIFRLRDEDFSGAPYLVPDAERVLMWRALWASKRKPVIGVAWTGGTKETAAHCRRVSLEELLPVFRAVDAHFVSLQYRDAQADIDAFRARHDVDLRQYPQATLANNFDETAALVASLDAAVVMQSTAVHICGALGVQCAALIPTTSQWRYGTSGDTLPWYASVRLIRQTKPGDWQPAIADAARWIRRAFS